MKQVSSFTPPVILIETRVWLVKTILNARVYFGDVLWSQGINITQAGGSDVVQRDVGEHLQRENTLWQASG